jgi:hypothetical protein
MRRFIEEVEKKFVDIFECERANFILVDRTKRDLYKYYYDAKSNSDVMKTFDIMKGLAGYVA